MRGIFNIPPPARCRVWHRYMTHTYELLPNPQQTVQEVGLYNGQVWCTSESSAHTVPHTHTQI